MPGGAPFKIRIARPLDGSQRVHSDLWHFVLEELKGGRIAEFRIASQMRASVFARAETIHQQEAHIRAGLLSGGEHLANDQVEESIPIAHRQEGFRLFQSHAGSQAAVELEHNGLGKHVAISLLLRDLLIVGQLFNRMDRAFRNQAAFIACQKAEGAFKRRNRRSAQTC